jgi:hypothetical protein
MAEGTTHRCVVYLKSGSTVTTETSDPEGFIRNLSGLMDGYFRRSLFKRSCTTVRLVGKPTVVVPIEHINFYSVEEKSSG